MANFCTKCGRQLSEGEICNCETNTSNVEQNQMTDGGMFYNNETNISNGEQNQTLQVSQTTPMFKSEKGKAIVSDLGSDFIGLLKKPANTARNFAVKGNMALAMILIALQGLVSGLFTMILCMEYNSDLEELAGIKGSRRSVDVDKLLKDVKLPTAGNFFKTWIFSIILSLAFAGIIFIILKLYGMNLNFKNVTCIVATKCAPIMVLDILACICCLFSTALGIGLFLMSSLIGLVYVICTFSITVDIDDNKKFFILTISVIVFLVVLYLFVKCSYTSYLSKEIREVFERIGKTFDPAV